MARPQAGGGPTATQAPTRSGIMAGGAGGASIISEYRPSLAADPNSEPYHLNLLLFNNIVQYKCSCGKFRRLNNTYFCRHCMAIRCRSCVAHEVDSQYCQHCLEYIPTIDPKFQMNKCASCYQCPSCQHLLSTSVLSILQATNEQQQPAAQQQPDEVIRRTCQLVCEFCRWSSETFITEGSRIVNNIADVEVPNSERITELISFYKAISQKEKTDKKKRRFHARTGNTMDLLKKYGIDNSLSPKLFESLRARTSIADRSHLSTVCNMEPANEDNTIETFRPAEPRSPDDLDELDTAFYYDKNFNIEQMSSITQRLAQVELQPDKIENFKPISKSLLVKRSLRCKECERNLCRSEYSPVSIRFKIQSAAYYHIPELKLRSDTYPLKLKNNEFNIIEFSIQNQTLSQIKFKFEPIEEMESDRYELYLPPYEMELESKDDTADFEHVPLRLRPLNEDTQKIFQSPRSRIGFFLKVKPKEICDMLSVEFLLSHDVLLIQNPKDNERVRVTHNMKVNLGPVE